MVVRVGLLELSRITAVQMKALRRIAKKTRRDRIRNERIREEMNQESVTVRLEEKQLKWFGHITRMNEESKPRQIWVVKVCVCVPMPTTALLRASGSAQGG